MFLGGNKAAIYDKDDPCVLAHERAVAAVKQNGGCVEAGKCKQDNGTVTWQKFCKDTTAQAIERASLVNQIKADEIESAGLTRMKKMASAKDANSEEKQAEVVSVAAEIEAETNETLDAFDAEQVAIATLSKERSRVEAHRNALLRQRSSL